MTLEEEIKIFSAENLRQRERIKGLEQSPIEFSVSSVPPIARTRAQLRGYSQPSSALIVKIVHKPKELRLGGTGKFENIGEEITN